MCVMRSRAPPDVRIYGRGTGRHRPLVVRALEVDQLGDLGRTDMGTN